MDTTVAVAEPLSETLWAVLNRVGQVVVIFGGGQAEAEARRWTERGYRIAPLGDD